MKPARDALGERPRLAAGAASKAAPGSSSPAASVAPSATEGIALPAVWAGPEAAPAPGVSSRLRAALDLRTGPLDTEEGRAFLQERIGFFGKVTFLLSAFFFIAMHALMQGRPGHGFVRCILEHGGYWHAVGASVSLAVWVTARSRPFGHSALVSIDAAGTLLSLLAYGVMIFTRGTFEPTRIDLAMMLVTMAVLTLRSVFVPSSLLHTLVVSLLGVLPVIGVTHLYAGRFPEAFAMPQIASAYIAIWGTVSVVIAVLASKVIYGLRAKVAEAQRLGQYVLDEKIGEGGMGAVYRARHALLRRPTAVKLVLPEKAGSGNLARFEREVQLTAQLGHPNTVSIYDYGRTPTGIFYYAMEYLDGINLEELVVRFGPQPPARVVHILKQVCGSLSEAHAAGLVHRDIKPGNIILSERVGISDLAKVVDFGLVKEIGADTADTALSQIDKVIGTPLYLAPESLITPEAVDGRADLYSLGAVGYYLLTGEPVFSGNSVVEICIHHLQTPPEPPSQRLGRPLPKDLERLILRCLAKKPDERPATAQGLQEELLACDIPPWSAADARAWWQRFGSQAKLPSALPKPPLEPQVLQTR
ncbi:MAG TPA: serine/threonine-protein kinase, partial [Polyangiaceae bacterium]|nr:serine/threonine-protein kinase [Polyangiaceae bacterium]